MTWWNLANAAIQASAEVALVCIAGAVLARYGVFSQQVQRSMAKANMVFFTPCLLFVKIAATVTPEKFAELWPVPLAFVVFSFLSYVLANVGSCVFRLSEPQKRLAIVSMMFSNSNSLPIALIQSLTLSKSVKIIYWGDEDTPEDVSARGMTYIMFFGLVGNFLRWSYGYELIGRGEGTVQKGRDGPKKPSDTGALSSACISCRGSVYSVNMPPQDTDTRISCENDQTPLLGEAAPSPLSCHCSDESTWLDRCPLLRRIGSMLKRCAFAVYSFLSALLTPPLLTTLVALFVGLVEPLRNLLFGPNAPLRSSVTAAIDQCGEAAVPLILLSLGAQLASLPKPKTVADDEESVVDGPHATNNSNSTVYERDQNATTVPDPSSGPSSSLPLSVSLAMDEGETVDRPFLRPSMETDSSSVSQSSLLSRSASVSKIPNHRTIALVIIGRLIVSPLIAAPMVFAARPYLGVMGSDPVFLLVLVILGSAPTAINLMQICQVHGAFEADMARLLFVSYIFAVPIMTAVVMCTMAALEAMKLDGVFLNS